MPMTQVEFDDFARRRKVALEAMVAAEAARDALSGGVASAEAAMAAAVNTVLVKARDLDILASEFNVRHADALSSKPAGEKAKPDTDASAAGTLTPRRSSGSR